MTAEIAILNKSAVALAADSAVTISTGSSQQKIFDSEDKLFELTCHSPIGVMINNTMSFMEAPLPVLIKKFRESAKSFRRVQDAAESFLKFLDEFAADSPKRIQDSEVGSVAKEFLKFVSDQAAKEFNNEFFDDKGGLKEELLEVDNLSSRFQDFMRIRQRAIVERCAKIAGNISNSEFIGDGELKYSEGQADIVRGMIEEVFPQAFDDVKLMMFELVQELLKKSRDISNSTGLIIAGFGEDDLFPTLISYEIYGAFGGKMLFRTKEIIDIDRNGERSKVVAFAQREMVDRFLYGLDGSIEYQIGDEASQSAKAISESILSRLDMPEGELVALRDTVRDAENAFASGLQNVFGAIRDQSREDIEGMVEFMPKPEMARMAEALVNLTSIKRRVSTGFETVGGPIDVAVISRSEGFVWVSRKHYFPAELNRRYFARTAPHDN